MTVIGSRHTLASGDHQLDVFVTRDGCEPWSVEVQPPMLSDHSLIIVTVDTQALAATLPRPFVCRRRRWAAFCLDDFISELNQSQLALDPPSNVDDLFACYDNTICNILDKLAPVADVRQYARHVAMVRPRLPCHQAADPQVGKNTQA